jgi:hypothetical protein
MHEKIHAPDYFFPAELFMKIDHPKFVTIRGGFFPGSPVQKPGGSALSNGSAFDDSLFSGGCFGYKFISHSVNP